MVDYLLEWGAAIKGTGALRAAASKGRVDVMEILLRHRADLNEMEDTRDYDGPAGTALHVAAAHGHAEAVSWLTEKGADPTLRNCDGLTAEDLASRD